MIFFLLFSFAVYLSVFTIVLFHGFYYILQLIYLNIFFVSVILVLSLINLCLVYLFKSIFFKSVPRTEKLWIFPILSIIFSVSFIVSVFYFPTYYENGFWSNFLGVPTIYFRYAVSYIIVALLFSIIYFSVYIASLCKKLDKINYDRLKWRKIKTSIIIIFLLSIVFMMLYISNYRKGTVYYYFANISFFKKDISASKELFYKSIKFSNSNYIKESSIFSLFMINYYFESGKNLSKLFNRVLSINKKSSFLDDMEYLIAKRNNFDLESCETFLKRYPESPWSDDVFLYQCKNIYKKNDKTEYKKMIKKINNFGFKNNVIIEYGGKISSMRTKKFFNIMKKNFY